MAKINLTVNVPCFYWVSKIIARWSTNYWQWYDEFNQVALYMGIIHREGKHCGCAEREHRHCIMGALLEFAYYCCKRYRKSASDSEGNDEKTARTWKLTRELFPIFFPSYLSMWNEIDATDFMQALFGRIGHLWTQLATQSDQTK